MLTLVLNHFPDMFNHYTEPFFKVGSVNFNIRVFKVCVNLRENPRISERCPTDHNKVTARDVHNLLCPFGTVNVSVCDYGNADGFSYSPYDIVINGRLVILLSCSAVNGDCRRTCRFADFCNFNGIYAVIIPTLADFYGYGYVGNGCHSLDDFSAKPRIFHQCTSAAV